MWPAIMAGVGAATNIASDLVGAHQDRLEQRREQSFQDYLSQKNIDLQKEFAQNGIQWKVKDAEAAGIHPLYALGANTTSFSPISVGSSGGGNSLNGNLARNMGQNISRAMNAAATQEDREMRELRLAAAKADVEGKTLENQIRLSQLNQMKAVGPPMAGSDNFIPGQGNSPLVEDQALKRTVSAPGRPAQEAGWRPDVSYSRTDTGLAPMIPTSLSESLEDDVIGSLMWRMRNQVMPNFTGEGKPPKTMLPPGANDWDYNFGKQEWQPVKGKGSYPYDRVRKSEVGKFFSNWKYQKGGVQWLLEEEDLVVLFVVVLVVVVVLGVVVVLVVQQGLCGLDLGCN